MPWSELERRLADPTPGAAKPVRPSPVPEWANGGDGPAWSRKREPYQPPEDLKTGGLSDRSSGRPSA
ncbi:MAG: hypothetical protein ABIP03_12925, partial [Aquihabitans sp.]